MQIMTQRRRGVLRSLEKRKTGPVRFHLLQTGMVLALCILLIGSFLGHSAETQTLQDLEYARVGETSLKLDLYIPPHDEGTRLPLVVWVHGGAWISGDKANPRAPRELGDRYIVASINYRLSKEATFPTQIYDCKAAIRWLRANADQYDIDPDRIGAWGGSAGGHLVALLGASGGVEELEGDVGDHLDRSSAVQAVCDFYGPTDLALLYEDTAKMDPRKNPLCLLLGGIPTEHPDLLQQANPITHVSPDDPPFLIMHGDKDLVVPLAQSEFLYAALQEAGVESTLRVIEGCEHGGFPPEAYEEVRRFFDEHLSLIPAAGTKNGDSPFGFHPGGVFKREYQDSGYTDATNIGVGWTRQGVYAFWFLIQPDLGRQVYDFSFYDRQYGKIPWEMNILANIAPQGGRDEGRCLPGSWLPVDEVQYAAFVTATVERYDGDGIDDMPGLVNPIRHWQVGNEPNDRRPSDFAELQRITYQAIKQACPDCTVLIGGVPGGPGHYITNFDMAYAPILAELAGQYVDVFDFHWYGTATGEYRLRDAATGEDVLEHIRATLTAHGFPADLPLWITEMGAYSGDPTREPDIFPFQTEQQQAQDYFKRFIYPLSRGVQKVFPAFGLMEGFKHDDGYFDHTGLIYDGEDSGDLGLGVKKLSYYTYKKMTEMLEGADWSTLTMLHDGTDSDHLYLFLVEKDGQPTHIAWWDYFDEPGYTPGDTKTPTLTGLVGMKATVTGVVPSADTGQDVTDYATAFTVTTHLISDGVATIHLGEDPVLIESTTTSTEDSTFDPLPAPSFAVDGEIEPLRAGNLLTNGDFESGHSNRPDGWTTFALPGGTGVPVFTWDETRSRNGSYSIEIENTGSKTGLWRQAVDVSPGTVYTLTGYVGFEGVAPPGQCKLRVVFRDAGNQIVQLVDLPAHDGTRPFELDFPYSLKFRAPADAVTAEINCLLQGSGRAWFDDITFAPAPVGRIEGRVTSGGRPVQRARVFIWGDPWGDVCEAYTDESGRYSLEDVPVAFPRYVVLASKEGYKTKPTGDVDISADGTTTVDFDLIAGSDPIDVLQVKYGCLELNHYAEPLTVPRDAIIPPDSNGYPASVWPYLESDPYITSDDPAVTALAEEILASIPAEERKNTYEVAWAVYEWIAKNINHDALFGNNEPYRDVTSGIWQTIQGEGWCWGKNFYDWGYKPAETLSVKCAICVEHSWLASALLRALNIPVRARVGSAQFWVQKPGEYGYWVGLSTSAGSNAYREHGKLGSGFGGSAFPSYFSVTSEPFLHEDWNMQNECLWRERHPWTETYAGDEAALAQAMADLDRFAKTGEANRGTPGRRGSDSYLIYYSDITINLFNVGDQRILDVRFPMISESATHTDMDHWAYWTNHPECVIRTWIEEITNPPIEGIQRWRHIEFDLTTLVEVE